MRLFFLCKLCKGFENKYKSMRHEALCKKLSFKKSSILYFPLLSVALSILLPACTFNTPIDKDLIPQISTHVDSTNTNAVNFYQTELANNEKWWLHFNDTQLNELVDIALANNHKLSATFARMKSSEALLKMTLAQNNPNLMLNSSANSDITSLKNIDTAALGLSSTWELDLWGGIAALEDKAQWDVIAKQFAGSPKQYID